MEQCHVFADDYTAEQTWALLDWCRVRGGEEFSLHFLETGRTGKLIDEALAALTPHELGNAIRSSLSADAKGSFRYERERWALTDASARLLRRYLPDGLFTKPSYADEGWLENLALYRDGELMLGIVSHEGEGLLRLTDLEVAQLAAAGFRTRMEGEWV